MPELPEVENVRRSLEPHVTSRMIRSVEVRRADVIRNDASPAALLVPSRIIRIDRLGKQLALVADDGRCVCVHLGMTGSLRWSATPPAEESHVHVRWRLADGSTLSFRDPRRFGGLWTFPDAHALHTARWATLGPDALLVTPLRLHGLLSRRRLPLKAALLDQTLVAGLGNIYVDELLFACRLSPLQPACTVTPQQARHLVRRMRTLLTRAIHAGGSTLRDYVDGNGAAGGFQNRHQVYGRGGEPCPTCRSPLAVHTIAGRTTVYCLHCQPTGASIPMEE